MREGMLHIRDVEGPKKTGSVETRLEAMEQQVFKSQGMVECGLNANHMMITEFTNKHKMDANDIGKHLSRLYDRVDQLQGQIYDLQNQNCFSATPEAVRSVWHPNAGEDVHSCRCHSIMEVCIHFMPDANMSVNPGRGRGKPQLRRQRTEDPEASEGVDLDDRE
ncbi:40S ribosomal protein S5-1 [Hordeum vulgare]|nr:40S ribosomal protein S5-1 [Hordeum vulgare]